MLVELYIRGCVKNQIYIPQLQKHLQKLDGLLLKFRILRHRYLAGSMGTVKFLFCMWLLLAVELALKVICERMKLLSYCSQKRNLSFYSS